MTHDGWVWLLAAIGALLQLPLFVAAVRQRVEIGRLLADPTFGDVNGGDAFGNAPPSGVERLAGVTRLTVLELSVSAVGIAFGVFATAVGLL